MLKIFIFQVKDTKECKKKNRYYLSNFSEQETDTDKPKMFKVVGFQFLHIFSPEVLFHNNFMTNRHICLCNFICVCACNYVYAFVSV